MKTLLLGVAIILAMLAAILPAVLGDLQREADAAPTAPRALAVATLAAGAAASRLALFPPAAYDPDAALSGEPGTRYAVRVRPGPRPGQVTITGIGQDLRSGEVRAVRAVYEPSAASQEQVRCGWPADGAPRCD